MNNIPYGKEKKNKTNTETNYECACGKFTLTQHMPYCVMGPCHLLV